ncbi:MAG: potassium/proton antiporter [Bacteroidales bacterium]|nr:potassium/proton antiporter [Bacteroidales bacterium]
MIFSAENILLLGSILLLVSIIAGKAGYKFGVPILLFFLIVGMLFGSDGLGIQFSNAKDAQFIGMIALSIILFSGGMDTKISEIRPVIGQGVVLSTVGVLATTFLTGFFIYWIWGIVYPQERFPLMVCLLMAAVMSSTDSASVFAILRSKNLNLKQNLRPMLELESGSNDPMAYMLTIIFIQIIQSASMTASEVALSFLVQFSVGAIAGYLFGRFTVYSLNHINIDNHSLYPVLLLTFVFLTFSITGLLNGNGYLAVYIAGLVVGNHKIMYKKNIATFFDGFAWLFQIIMFLSLGLLVNPHELLGIAAVALLIGIFMIVIGRPLSVFLCLLPFRKMTMKARLYVSWVGLRGAVPIIFATYPLIADVEGARQIFNVVFFITILSLVVQGTTVPLVAKLLGLASTEKEKDNEFGMELPDEIQSILSEISVSEDLLVAGDRLMDLPVPEKTLVVMIKRENRYLIPNGQTQLQINDKLLLISNNEQELRQIYDRLGIKRYTFYRN